MNIENKTLFLPADQMPVSFTGQFLYQICNSNILNPSNKDQGKVSIWIGKPLRAIARMLCTLVIPIFAALAGASYHSIASLTVRIQARKWIDDPIKHSNLIMLAQAHAYAALIDAIVFFSTIAVKYPCARAFSFVSSESAAFWTAKHFPEIKVENELTYKEVIREQLLRHAMC